MIRRRIKKITELTFLIAIRQIWKLLCNLYHLLTDPFLTLKDLWQTKDKSQIFLISLTFISPIVVYVLARIVWDYYRYKLIVNDVGMFFKIVIFLELAIFLYMSYWITKLCKRK